MAAAHDGGPRGMRRRMSASPRARSTRPTRTRRATSSRTGGRPLSAVRSGITDLAPTPLSRRTWSTYNIAALWIGMSVVITTYTLASGLMQQGMTWWQAMVTILLGNTIVLVPMVLNAHAGTKYGISFPGAVPRELRRARRQHPGDAARDRRLRMVRHPDVDRRARARHAVHRGVAGLERGAGRHRASRSRSFWLIQVAIIARRHRGHQDARELRRAAAARRRASCCSSGASGTAAGSGTSSPNRSDSRAERERLVLDALPAGAHRERRLLGDAQPQHPRLHALREEPALAGRWARRSACRRR